MSNWNKIREDIVREAIEAKFDQNSDIKLELLKTGNNSLVFHSNDNFMGDGLQGHGKNTLGKFLMYIRQISSVGE